MQQSIIVYDTYEIPLSKYPQNDVDKIIITFLMHEEVLKKLAQSYSNSLKYYNECKEYYYVFNFNKFSKKYSAQEIILLFNNITDFLKLNYEINKQIKYLNSLNIIDKIFYFYIKNKEIYMNLFESIEHAKTAFFERRDYTYKIIIPSDFYSNIYPITYSAIQLMEINSYAQYLIKHKIIKELPLPKY